MATAADVVMVTVAIVAIVATAVIVVVIAIEARATATEVQVAMVVDMGDTMAPLKLQPLRLLLLTLTLKLLITTPSTRSGPLTTPRTRPKTHTLPTAASQQSWLSIRKVTDSTMAKLTRPDRHSPLPQELQHHRHHLQSLLVTELLHRLLRHPPLRLELATVQSLLHQACKCFAASSISPKCIEHSHSPAVRQAHTARRMHSLGSNIGEGITQQIPEMAWLSL